jgi:acetyltransferase-like isoleucine patch superfamily enzyme
MKGFRIAITALSIVVVQTLTCAIAIAPAVFLWTAAIQATSPASTARLIVAALLLVPCYVLFALCLMPVSASMTRLTGARTPPGLELRISEMSWPLMRWAHYMAASHIVRLISGSLFRASPIWTAYLRMNGARIGRRVFVNTLSIADHNLLEFGDDVVIGADVHVSGHTIEGGLLKTARVRLGSNVTIGLGSVIDIGVEIGPHCQVGALSLVPKHTKLDGQAVYVGIPVRRVGPSETLRV